MIKRLADLIQKEADSIEEQSGQQEQSAAEVTEAATPGDPPEQIGEAVGSDPEP